jgi:MinD-like ATPase involved in chromosome partitioning or flagellar assembly
VKTFWITFYSYKGGVGRSLALANTAALLVQRGRRVVLIDFDLEAPGLDSFEEFESAAGKPGVVEYVTEFEKTKRAPDISHFIHACDLPGQLRGKLWIMPAGKKDAAYNACRAKLDWVGLYERGLGEPFVENWKAAIARHCQPDYVFVDSRTGLTDVAGICTLHLPDLVVMLFGLNEQNVRGVAAVAKTIRESDLTRLPQIHYVASPVPNLPWDKKGPLARRMQAVTNELGTRPKSIIRYQQIAALNERLFVLDPDLEFSPLVESYENLLKRLIDYNRSGIDFLCSQARKAIESVNTLRMQRLVAVLEQEYPNRADGLLYQSQLKLALGEPHAAKELAQKALETDPTFEQPFDWLLEQYQHDKQFPEALSLCDTVLKVSDILPPDRLAEIHNDRGIISMAAGRYKAASESFKFCLQNKKSDENIPIIRLVRTFNYAEALRRSGRKPRTNTWKGVIALFNESGETSDTPLIFQANRWQAMHIPFALNGDVHRAREALAKARHAAELVGMAEDIFNVKTYTEVPVEEFVKINDEMLAALDRGQLWDGMPLPPGASTTKRLAPKSQK